MNKANKIKDIREYNKDTETAYISRTKRYVDEYGNEGSETEIYKKVYGGKHFWKVWLGDLLYTLGLISNSKQLDVVFYVMENTDASSNLYINSIANTAKEAGVAYSTASIIFRKMQEVDMIAKKQNGVYQVKPTLMMKGDEKKKHRLVVEYDNIKHEE